MGTDSMVYNLGVVGEGGHADFMLPAFLCSFCSPYQPFIALVNIFLYKNRNFRNHSVHLPCFLQVLWYVDYVVILLGIIPISEVQGKMGIEFAACLPIVSLILVAMAYKGVNDDVKLVRAADRIR